MKGEVMKNYIEPMAELIEYDLNDVITTSIGTQTPVLPEGEGEWSPLGDADNGTSGESN